MQNILELIKQREKEGEPSFNNSLGVCDTDFGILQIERPWRNITPREQQAIIPHPEPIHSPNAGPV
jgi:hypothetical protein